MLHEKPEQFRHVDQEYADALLGRIAESVAEIRAQQAAMRQMLASGHGRILLQADAVGAVPAKPGR